MPRPDAPGPVRKSSVEPTELPDGLALFDPDHDTAHHLNPVATLVWELLDGRAVSEIIATVAAVLETDPATAATWVTSAIDSFRAQGLLR